MRQRGPDQDGVRRSPGRAPWRLAWVLVVLAAGCATGCASGRSGAVRGGGWEVFFDDPAPDDPEADSLYLELLDNDAVERGYVDVAVQLHRMRPRLVRARGTVAYGVTRATAESGPPDGPALAFREWDEGWYFERCRTDVEYDVEPGIGVGEVAYEVGVAAMGLVGRLLTGSCEGARDTGRLIVLRFELLRPGTVVLDVDPDGSTTFDSTAGERMTYAGTYGGTLRVRRVR